jgi:apolipoprotein N-acyltransferase
MGIFIFLTFPPLGLWGWGSPLLCAGYLLPGTREAGPLLLLIVWPALWHCAGERRGAFRAAIAVTVLYAAFMSPSSRLQARSPEDWKGLYTPFGMLYSGSSNAASAYLRYRMLSVVLEKTTAKYIVLPETIAGWWGTPTEDLWRPTTDLFASQGRTYFVGAETPLRGTKKYYNVVQIRGSNHGTVEQRYPVPFSMWNPFREKGAVANFFRGGGVARVDDLSVGILICYEPYLYYPSIMTLVRRPDVLVVVSNSWWSRTTNIPLLSDKCAVSWALLFDVPLVLSKNI